MSQDFPFEILESSIEGELYFGNSIKGLGTRKVYATDASVYQELPMAVCLPKSVDDLRLLIDFANKHRVTLIPRAAGTSLAGQVVGAGIIVDISRYFNSVVELNEKEQWVRVQPGVVRDDLNQQLKKNGLMFGPETSTSNRAMIGGMIGNNSCGLHSIIWGDTRTNLLEVTVLLNDNSLVSFGRLTKTELEKKLELSTLEGEIYRKIHHLLDEADNRDAIRTGFPKPSVKRRNTGYALDSLLAQFEQDGTFNLASLVAGSEGTLCFIVEAKLQLLPLPPVEKGMVAVHTNSIAEALQVNLVALEHKCAASELVDDVILAYTKNNITQSKNRFFVEGHPKTILMVEFMSHSTRYLLDQAQQFIEALKTKNLGYAWPVLLGADCNKAWELRKAGLGLLRNEPGDVQPVNLIEDCAVDVQDLAAYVAEVETLLQTNSVKYSMYAHAGAGELHIEPMINLKTPEGRELFKNVLHETAALVKKYRGSLSGEHGDGRLRGEYIPFVMGEQNYELFRQIKKIFDPAGIFNKGKIVDTPAMNHYLRYDELPDEKKHKTLFSFSREESILHLAEKCSGSGDCRKTRVSGGTMCPSYMATFNERDTTRARANMLRHFYTHTDTNKKSDYEEVKDILDLCLSCKGCKAECPSAVDVGKMKAEFTQQYYEAYGAPLRAKMIGNFTGLMKLASPVAPLYNLVYNTPALRRVANRLAGFHPDRTMPGLHGTTLRSWFRKNAAGLQPKGNRKGIVNLFCDEFSNYNDVEIGKKAIRLLAALGYQVMLPDHIESGRSSMSKGFIKKAQQIAAKNVDMLRDVVSENAPLIGLEPSAILCFRDEYPDLVPENLAGDARKLAKNSFLFEEWLAMEADKGNIVAAQFTKEKKKVLLHGHCHQKALSSTTFIVRCLSLPANFEVSEIPSGCCGMAGSFGYEKEHYKVSMQIGELVLFPAVRASGDAIVAASGTSCRHQVKDGTGKIAKHTAEILFEALPVGSF